MDLTHLLRSCHLFSDLDERDLQAMQQIAVRQDYRKGQIIFDEGSPSHGFYLVVTGTVKIYRVGADGRERILHVVEAGDSFAEAALFMETYPATAETMSHSTIILVNNSGFKRLITHDPKLNLKIIGTLVKSLSQMRNALTDLTLKEVPARFASYVLSLSREMNKPILVTISKTTVAQMIGTTKETFSRLLRRLNQHRILTYRGNQVRVFNRARLEAIASGDEKI